MFIFLPHDLSVTWCEYDRPDYTALIYITITIRYTIDTFVRDSGSYIYYCSILQDNLNVFSVSVTLSALSSYIYLTSVQSFKIQIYREDGNSSVSGHHNPQSPRFKF